MSGVMKRITALLLSIMLAAIAIAQEDLVEKQPLARRYTVELIVFSYAEDVSIGTEQFFALQSDVPVIADDELLATNGEGPLPDDSAQVFDLDSFPDPESLESPFNEIELVILPEDDYTMIDIVEQLELLDVYQPILHVAWTQATYPKEATPAIQLHAFGATPAGLEGSFTLYLSRYLHLVVDLTLDVGSDDLDTAAAITGEHEPVISFGDSRLQDGVLYGPADDVTRYRLQEHRIVKNGELRYFDHPKFGVIARATRVEEDVEELDDEINEPSRE